MSDPFGRRSPVPPPHLREADGSLSVADEVAWLRERAAVEWLARHGVSGVTPAQLLARVAEVGEDLATAEMLDEARRRENGGTLSSSPGHPVAAPQSESPSSISEGSHAAGNPKTRGRHGG